MKIIGGGNMDDNLTPLDDIPFALVAEMAKTWSEKAQEVGAEKTEMPSISFNFWVHNGTRLWNAANIDTEREQYYLFFNMDGTVQEFKKKLSPSGFDNQKGCRSALRAGLRR